MSGMLVLTDDGYRGRLFRFYLTYNRAKADPANVDKLLRYAGDEEELFELLVHKYGPEPPIDWMPRFVRYFAAHCPSMIGDSKIVQSIVDGNKGTERLLMTQLVELFGPEPDEQFLNRPDSALLLYNFAFHWLDLRLWDQFSKTSRYEIRWDVVGRHFGKMPVSSEQVTAKSKMSVSKEQVPEESYLGCWPECGLDLCDVKDNFSFKMYFSVHRAEDGDGEWELVGRSAGFVLHHTVPRTHPKIGLSRGETVKLLDPNGGDAGTIELSTECQKLSELPELLQWAQSSVILDRNTAVPRELPVGNRAKEDFLDRYQRYDYVYRPRQSSMFNLEHYLDVIKPKGEAFFTKLGPEPFNFKKHVPIGDLPVEERQSVVNAVKRYLGSIHIDEREQEVDDRIATEAHRTAWQYSFNLLLRYGKPLLPQRIPITKVNEGGQRLLLPLREDDTRRSERTTTLFRARVSDGNNVEFSRESK